ncbi:MAG: hypothetical protein II186_08115, partial [Erysipelotrichales bacterium]|nr:hypothetical protein [Erysipelotrichales bacterium]
VQRFVTELQNRKVIELRSPQEQNVIEKMYSKTQRITQHALNSGQRDAINEKLDKGINKAAETLKRAKERMEARKRNKVQPNVRK